MRSFREMSLYAQWQAEINGHFAVIDHEPDLKGLIRMVIVQKRGADPIEVEEPPAVIRSMLLKARSESTGDKQGLDKAIKLTELAIEELERRQRVERGQT